MLDEVDKLGRDFRGDPASALLEILDPAQNHTFRDNYLDLPFDLSKVFFIATANALDPLPRPLLDRMEVLRLSGYSEEEKFEIARRYLIPRHSAKPGLTAEQFVIPDETLRRDHQRLHPRGRLPPAGASRWPAGPQGRACASPRARCRRVTVSRSRAAGPARPGLFPAGRTRPQDARRRRRPAWPGRRRAAKCSTSRPALLPGYRHGCGSPASSAR